MYRNKTARTTLAIFVVLGSAASAQDKAGAASGGTGLKPGLWEIASSHDALDAKSKRTVTSRICYSASDVAVASRMIPPTRGLGVKCEVPDVKSAAPNITWKAVCKGKEGSSLASAGSMKVDATTYSAEVRFEQKGVGKVSLLEEKISARRVGDCS